MIKQMMPDFYKSGVVSLTSLALSLIPGVASAVTPFEECLLNQALSGSGNKTLNEIRASCQQVQSVITGSDQPTEINASNNNERVFEHSDVWETSSSGALSERTLGEAQARENRFTIIPHKPNYLLPVSWNSNVNVEPFKDHLQDGEFSSTEIKFQLSLKAPLVDGLWNGYGRLYAAYTGTSWWQAYNANSAPFRETNHEPEVFASFSTNYQLLGMDLKAVVVGASHQSNGRSGALSRSWNRIYTTFLFEKDDFYLLFKPWYRIPEAEKDPLDSNTSDGDDNPDIEKYMGNGELQFGYKFDKHQVSMMLRNNLRRSDNLGAARIDWSFPLNDRFRGYVQYFNGYGESLIDYNASVNRLSIGVMLTDWL